MYLYLDDRVAKLVYTREAIEAQRRRNEGAPCTRLPVSKELAHYPMIGTIGSFKVPRRRHARLSLRKTLFPQVQP